MRLFSFFFFFFPVFCLAQQVEYTVFYNEKMADNGLKINMRFSLPKAADSTYVQYSNEVWGEKNLTHCLTNLESTQPNYRFKIVADSNRIIIYHPKTKIIDFFYTLKQDYKGDSIHIFNRPRIKNEYFHILGQSLFPVPEYLVLDTEKAEKAKKTLYHNITITWRNFPANYTLHNTFATQAQKQVLKLRLWEDLYNSLFVGGDYRIHRFDYEKKPIYLAIRGNWQTYTDEKLKEALQKSISTQRKFWNDNSFDFYTIIMTPTVTQSDSLYDGQSIMGSGIRNGFLIQSSNNPFNSWGSMKYVFNHEMMHDWIGGKIPMQHEELNYWFSEGFTDYYTYKNRLQSSDIDFGQWLKTFNSDVIAAHFKNPERNQPNYIIKDKFWQGRNFEKIPYRRGAIFAFWLDNQIQKRTKGKKSLDDLMRDLLRICVSENRKFTDELFLAQAQTYLNEDIAYFFQKHVISGVDFDFKTEDLIKGFEVEYNDGMMVLKGKGS